MPIAEKAACHSAITTTANATVTQLAATIQERNRPSAPCERAISTVFDREQDQENAEESHHRCGSEAEDRGLGTPLDVSLQNLRL